MPRYGSNTRETSIERMAGKAGDDYQIEKELFCQETGVHPSTVDRWTRGFRPSHSRADAGKRRIEATEEEIQGAIDFVMNHEYLSCTRVVELLELNGLRAGVLPDYMLRKILRERGLSHKRRHTDVEPARRWDALYPNHFWEIDSTKLQHLHLYPETMRVSFNPRLNYKNSRGERAAPLWLYIVIDRFSRVEFPYLAIGQHWINNLKALQWAASEKANPTEFPASGLPEYIRSDNGGGNQAKGHKEGVKQLDIKYAISNPSSWKTFGSRAHGLNERSFPFYNSWEQEFRLRQSFTWEETQEFLYQAALRRNRRMHPTTGERPFERWLRIEKPKMPPAAEAFKLLTYEHDRRKINRWAQFELKNKNYWAKRPEIRSTRAWRNLVDEWVMVYWLRGEENVVYLMHSTLTKPIECAPVEDVVRLPFRYENVDPTNVDEARERAKATGTYGDLKLWEKDTTAPAYLPKRGLPFDDSKIKLDPPPAVEPMDHPAVSTPTQRLVDKIWLSKIGVATFLQQSGFFGKSLNTDEIAWRDDLMAKKGQETIDRDGVTYIAVDEDDVVAAMKSARETRAAETGEPCDIKRPFFRGDEDE